MHRSPPSPNVRKLFKSSRYEKSTYEPDLDRIIASLGSRAAHRRRRLRGLLLGGLLLHLEQPLQRWAGGLRMCVAEAEVKFSSVGSRRSMVCGWVGVWVGEWVCMCVRVCMRARARVCVSRRVRARVLTRARKENVRHLEELNGRPADSREDSSCSLKHCH